MKKSKAQLDKFQIGIAEILVGALPASINGQTNHLPKEIAHRIAANVPFVSNKAGLRDQALLVLADYRNHSWTEKRLAGEGTRLSLADSILSVL